MKSRYATFGMAGGIFALDRLTKVVIERQVSVWDTHAVIPAFFNIVHTKNPGAAFGFLAEASESVRALFLVGLSLAVLLLVGWMLWQASKSGAAAGTAQRVGLALVLGGALGNLYDRILYGAVTDFLEFYAGSFVWPAFNIADSAITIGAALLLLDIFRSGRQPVHNT